MTKFSIFILSRSNEYFVLLSDSVLHVNRTFTPLCVRYYIECYRAVPSGRWWILRGKICVSRNNNFPFEASRFSRGNQDLKWANSTFVIIR